MILGSKCILPPKSWNLCKNLFNSTWNRFFFYPKWRMILVYYYIIDFNCYDGMEGNLRETAFADFLQFLERQRSRNGGYYGTDIICSNWYRIPRNLSAHLWDLQKKWGPGIRACLSYCQIRIRNLFHQPHQLPDHRPVMYDLTGFLGKNEGISD